MEREGRFVHMLGALNDFRKMRHRADLEILMARLTTQTRRTPIL